MIKTRLSHLAFAAAALLLSALPASAQFNQATPTPKFTFGASAVGLVNAATATDIVTLTGSATKLIQVTFVQCSGISSGTATTADLALVKRTTANTGGTFTSAAISQFDSKSPAPTAVFKSYTANPTGLGTASGVLSALKLNLPVTTTSNALATTWSMTDFPYTYPVVLRGVGESLAINGNATLPAANIDCTINWTEQ